MAQATNGIATISEAMNVGWGSQGVFDANLFGSNITAGTLCLINDSDVLEICGVDIREPYADKLAIKYDGILLALYRWPRFRLEDLIDNYQLYKTIYLTNMQGLITGSGTTTLDNDSVTIDSTTNTIRIGYPALLDNVDLEFSLYLKCLPNYHYTVSNINSNWSIEFQHPLANSGLSSNGIFNNLFHIRASWYSTNYPGNSEGTKVDRITLKYSFPNSSTEYMMLFNVQF